MITLTEHKRRTRIHSRQAWTAEKTTIDYKHFIRFEILDTAIHGFSFMMKELS